jgi:hypothetical protein
MQDHEPQFLVIFAAQYTQMHGAITLDIKRLWKPVGKGRDNISLTMGIDRRTPLL